MPMKTSWLSKLDPATVGTKLSRSLRPSQKMMGR